MSEDDINHKISTRLNEFTLQLSEHLSQTVAGAVKLAVQEKVNGKIDKLTVKIDDYIKDDMDWKRESEDMRAWFKNFTLGKKMIINATKVISIIGGAIIALGGAWVIIKAFIAQQLK